MVQGLHIRTPFVPLNGWVIIPHNAGGHRKRSWWSLFTCNTQMAYGIWSWQTALKANSDCVCGGHVDGVKSEETCWKAARLVKYRRWANGTVWLLWHLKVKKKFRGKTQITISEKKVFKTFSEQLCSLYFLSASPSIHPVIQLSCWWLCFPIFTWTVVSAKDITQVSA